MSLGQWVDVLYGEVTPIVGMCGEWSPRCRDISNAETEARRREGWREVTEVLEQCEFRTLHRAAKLQKKQVEGRESLRKKMNAGLLRA